jgi:hypothetical protein
VPDQIFEVLNGGPNQTNVTFFNNTIDSKGVAFSTASGSAKYVLIPENNTYIPAYLEATSVRTNAISYVNGPRVRMSLVQGGNVFVLQDATADKIPEGAYFEIDNRSNTWKKIYGGTGDVIVYPSQTMNSSVLVPFGSEQFFYWNGNAWMTNAPVTENITKPAPHKSLRIMN